MPKNSTLQTAQDRFASIAEAINGLDEQDKSIMQSVLAAFWETSTDHDLDSINKEQALLLFNQSIETVEKEEDVEWEEGDHRIFQRVRDYLNAAPDVEAAIKCIEKFADDLADELD